MSDADHTTTQEPALMPRRRRDRTPVGGPIRLNLTPMIDMVFQLLIYFVVTAGFVADEGALTTSMPRETGESKAVAALPREPLRILLQKIPTGVTMRLENAGQTVTDVRALTGLLEAVQWNPDKSRAGAFRPEHPVRVEVGRDVPWEAVVNALGAAAAADYTRVEIAQP
ncbi:MAG: biopolymer transporter ExbD [Phycisphaeraceae bacterium]|nr:biopolymer transporter ExbD [Phycisphaeraceae bacterium]